MATGTRLTTRAAHRAAALYAAGVTLNALILDTIGASDPGDSETPGTGIFDSTLNTVSDVLAVAGVTELVATGYSRQTMSPGLAATEDDTNRWSTLAGPIATWAGITLTGGAQIGAFVLYEGTLSGGTGQVHMVTNAGCPFTLTGAYTLSLDELFARVAIA